MSIFCKCRLCRRVLETPMETVKFWDPEKREVPGVQEGDSCYITDHLCETCATFYAAYVRQAERQASYILYRDKDPLAELIAQQNEEMPTNCDGAWNFIKPYDDLSNEILETVRVLWQEGPDRPLTISEIVRFMIDKEKEAAADADKPAESEDK